MIDSYELFNKKLVEFAEDLIYICPDVTDFRLFYNTCVWAISFRKEFCQEFFQHNVLNLYGPRIHAKDESFFLQESYEVYHEFLKENYNDLNLLQQLKNIWKDLDAENKDTVWKYLKLLCILCEKCNSCGGSNQ